MLDGEGSCPTAAEINLRLEALSREVSPNAKPDLLRITQTETDLDLEMTVATSGVVLHRKLPRPSSCEERATLIATVIASWNSELEETAKIAPPPPPLPLPSPPPLLAPPQKSTGFEVHGAFVGSLAGSSFAPGGSIEVRLSPRRSRWGIHLGLLGMGLREFPLGMGQVDFTRATLRTGLGYRFGKKWAVELYGEAQFALLYFKGRGFDQTLDGFDFDAGLGGGARLSVRLGHVRPFLGLGVVGWLRKEQVRADEGQGTQAATIPRLEILMELGIGVGNQKD